MLTSYLLRSEIKSDHLRNEMLKIQKSVPKILESCINALVEKIDFFIVHENRGQPMPVERLYGLI